MQVLCTLACLKGTRVAGLHVLKVQAGRVSGIRKQSLTLGSPYARKVKGLTRSPELGNCSLWVGSSNAGKCMGAALECLAWHAARDLGSGINSSDPIM